ncbi:MAG: Smr/MutS family protein, partial [Bacteroidota bacterium]
IQAFETYIARAIELGIPYVYIIHGKGTGRLRSIIELKLSKNTQVKSFEGGYHEGYEFGATKVYF